MISICDKIPNMEFVEVLAELEKFEKNLEYLAKEVDNLNDKILKKYFFPHSNYFKPQNSMPDVLIWMLCGNERTAYFRIPAHEILYSPNSEYNGEFCNKSQTITLKVRCF